MSGDRRVRPHNVVPQLLPFRVRPRHRERTGSFLIRLAEANRCPPWSFLWLLGTVRGGQRAELIPQARVTLNGAALTRLVAYLGRPVDQIIRALPTLPATDQTGEPAVRIQRPGRNFLRSCPGCELRAGGLSLLPGSNPLDLTCRRHHEWLVAGEDIALDQASEVQAAVNRLHRLRRRHGDRIVSGDYRGIHHYLTDDWRGTRWHRLLAQRWLFRQRMMFTAAHPNDEFVRTHTHHWSMLPEVTALVWSLANSSCAVSSAEGISRALRLEEYGSTIRLGSA
ncbi:TniQ family protein [Nakamurella multipartita]|uniref:TniQ domain-containing protein n=1 Tax=Nakamurella multipartita (strain ATCC 700099 / DSM 44233 / CIP 104796 / JCM 9543 / NBRC 105858 / Y-104) TaxID=479431 RepID=C8X7F2_NAKMY|nr:TniQ family protein [Nakamurella multipartita]ACV78905.1 hypothetical protein Namu_2547 [Nakamurella multipartita DSM 44233]